MHRFGAFFLGALLLGFAAPAAQDPPLWLRTPAISPDGKALAFSYQGNLYRVAATGGPAVPLTLGESHAFMPVWSPDGKWIAFASDRSGNFDVYLMPAEGGVAKRLTFHSSPDLPSAFTPDGKSVLFTSPRLAPADYAQFPYRAFAETYTVPVTGGAARMLSPTPMQAGVFDAKGAHILFQDIKGGENPWRKHQTSSVAKDIGLYDVAAKRFLTLTDNPGDDRNPVFGADGTTFFFLSERGGEAFNVYRSSLADPSKATAVTRFRRHPVRFLSASREGTLAFAWDGELYTQKADTEPKKVDVRIQVDPARGHERFLPVNGGLTELEVSPTGKEVAFVVRGEVYVSSLEGGITRRITDTPGQERSVSFSPDGRTLLYAGERDGSWNIYASRIVRPDEPAFYAATRLEEKPLVATAADEFQPLFSPDGKEVAFLQERTTLRVVNLASGKVRTVLEGDRNYSYSDGDQDFTWSPDGKWLVAGINVGLGWLRDIALVAADASGKVVNLTRSGSFDSRPRFSPDGSMIYWASDREGYRNLNQQPATLDIFGLFLTQKAMDRYRLSKEEFALVKEREDKDAKEKTKEEKKEERKDIVVEWEGLEDRKVRLSAHTADLGDAALSKNGEKLYYLARFEKGYDLWVTELRTRETKLLAKLDARQAGFRLASDGKALLVVVDGRVAKVDAESGKRDAVAINGEMRLREAEERAAIYEHAWRQLEKKFYVKDLHGVDWPYYVNAYRRFLPHIGDNVDFAELLSELLGELNASHTGGRYAAPQENRDATASLGLFFDPRFEGKGLKVTEVLHKGPLDRAGAKVKPGHLLVAIDGTEITPAADPSVLLNRKAGRPTLLTFQDGNERWEETAKPLMSMQENELLYQRWVDRSRARVEKLSGGRLGYVHVRGMNDPSMRTVMEEVLGQHLGKEALVVDTRFNGGGNLHEQLSDFLSGRKYFDVVPRGQAYGHQPMLKWTKPSIVVMGEANYSDAHLFPVAYKLKNLGKTVGMPVPGTGTFVWWETQIDPTLVFGIPQGGWRTPDGRFCENTQLEPDLRIANTPESLAEDRDLQIEAAVRALLEQLRTR
jgi:Tol biopolymer transport system component/C-terminal processing protease CtpA/Prc